MKILKKLRKINWITAARQFFRDITSVRVCKRCIYVCKPHRNLFEVFEKKYLKSITALQFTDEAKYKKRSMGSHILLIECEIVVAINWKFNPEVDLKRNTV